MTLSSGIPTLGIIASSRFKGDRYWLSILEAGLQDKYFTIYSMTLDSSNAIYASGELYGDRQLCLVKVNKNGSVQWKKTYISSNYSLSNTNTFLDSLGNIYLVCDYTFYNSNLSVYENKVICIKLDSLGEIIWQKRIDKDFYTSFSSYATLKNDFIYILIYGDKKIIKLDSDGNIVLTKKINYEGPGLSRPTSIDVDSSGNIYLIGNTSISSGTPSVLQTIIPFVVKFSPLGNIIWSKEAVENFYRLNNIFIDSLDNIYLTGSNITYVDPNWGYTTDNPILLKADSSFSFQWQKKISTYNQTGDHIALSSDDHVYVAAGDTYRFNFIKCTTTGDTVWQQGYEFNNNDWFDSIFGFGNPVIEIGLDNNIYFGGQITRNSDSTYQGFLGKLPKEGIDSFSSPYFNNGAYGMPYSEVFSDQDISITFNNSNNSIVLAATNNVINSDLVKETAQTVAINDELVTLKLPSVITTSTLNICTNSYICFNGFTGDYNGLSASYPAFPKIFLSADDRSASKVYYKILGNSPNRSVVVRFEGYSSSSVGGSPSLEWEMIFYEATPNQIDIHFGVNDASGTGITGVYTENSLITTFDDLSNTSVRVLTTGGGAGTSTVIPNSIKGNTSMIEVLGPTAYGSFGNLDEGVWGLNFPFPITFNGVTY